MAVAYLEITIRIFGVKSLKEKRSIVKRMVNDLRNKFNVSVIELDDQDSKEYITIGLSFVSINKSAMDRTCESIIEYLENIYNVENVYKEVYD